MPSVWMEDATGSDSKQPKEPSRKKTNPEGRERELMCVR